MKFFKKILVFIIVILFFSNQNYAQKDSTIINFLKKTEISGQWFLEYEYNILKETNKFALKRGYFTIKSDLNENISVRYTQDITLDDEGDDAGNIEMRLKFLFLKYQLPKNTFLKNTYFEFGLVNRPFISFEQKINEYRLQNSMFTEKNNLVASADFGITYYGLFGKKLDKNIEEKIGNSDGNGKFGSFSIGIYNGGGYHAIEKNNNKVFEGRITLRPLPNFIPYLQLSYIKSFGKANIELQNLNFDLDLFYLSFQHSNFVFTAQYYFGKGGFEGDYYDFNGNPLNNNGFSFFTEITIPKTKFSVFSRYDNLKFGSLPIVKETYFGGISYRFLKSKLVSCYSTEFYGSYRNSLAEIILEVVF